MSIRHFAYIVTIVCFKRGARSTKTVRTCIRRTRADDTATGVDVQAGQLTVFWNGGTSPCFMKNNFTEESADQDKDSTEMSIPNSNIFRLTINTIAA